mmetsp:Transcript_19609/g.45572  ORF Transcript_19609/g.45572 Transcript_19609/m.45572 type:complete len:272 (+) Transcript_19609:306-1121(+)
MVLIGISRTVSHERKQHQRERTTAAGAEAAIDPEGMRLLQHTQLRQPDLHRQRLVTTPLQRVQKQCRHCLRQTGIDHHSSHLHSHNRRGRHQEGSRHHMGSRRPRVGSLHMWLLVMGLLQQAILLPNTSCHQLAMACLQDILHPDTRHRQLGMDPRQDTHLQGTHLHQVMALLLDILRKGILNSLVMVRLQDIHLLDTHHRQVMVFLLDIHLQDTLDSQSLAMALRQQDIHLQGTLHRQATTLLHQACLHSLTPCLHHMAPSHHLFRLAGT